MDTRSSINTLSKAPENALSNQLLAVLGRESLNRIDPHLQPVTLKLGAVAVSYTHLDVYKRQA